jgi:hydroxypyruvate isomerase
MSDPLIPTSSTSTPWPRRELLKTTLGLGAAGALGLANAERALAAAASGPAVTRARLRHSIVQWCFETFGGKWNVEKTCRVARELGCQSVELLAPEHFATVKRHGLVCAIGQINMDPDPPFLKGFNNPAWWPKVIPATRDAIDAAAAAGFPSVICFTGHSAKDPSNPSSPHLTLEEGARNCVEGLKQVVGYAEEKKVNLCLEMLNSRETSHPMKGHPGYQGDHTDYCIDIIKRVGSPRMKLLFDVYHVQIMDGDLVRRIHQFKDYIGHVHVAGNPGRGEPDIHQEINFRPVMQALVDIQYGGYVGQEFIPTRDPLHGLREAVTLCDV